MNNSDPRIFFDLDSMTTGAYHRDGGIRPMGHCLITKHITQIRNPCYDVGDVGLLETADIPDLHHLRDCLVLSTQGPRPQADELSGGG